MRIIVIIRIRSIA